MTQWPPALDFLKSFDRKLLIDLGIRYGLVVFFFAVLLIPSCGRYQSLKGQLGAKKALLQTARLKLSQAQKAQIDRNAIAGEILSFEERFFTDEELSQMLGMVSDLAKQNNLQMRSSKPIKETAPPTPAIQAIKPPAAALPAAQTAGVALYSDQEFEIELTGTYHSLGHFLSDLRDYKKFIRAKKVSMLGAAIPQGGHEIRLILQVYLRNQEA